MDVAPEPPLAATDCDDLQAVQERRQPPSSFEKQLPEMENNAGWRRNMAVDPAGNRCPGRSFPVGPGFRQGPGKVGNGHAEDIQRLLHFGVRHDPALFRRRCASQLVSKRYACGTAVEAEAVKELAPSARFARGRPISELVGAGKVSVSARRANSRARYQVISKQQSWDVLSRASTRQHAVRGPVRNLIASMPPPYPLSFWRMN